MPRRSRIAILASAALSAACAGPSSEATDAAPRDVAEHRDGGSDASTCPLDPPTPSAPCSLAASARCSFGDPCSFDRFACVKGRWTEPVIDGAAPRPCPETTPATGSTCASCGRSQTCTYSAACGATTTSTCSGGHWLTGTGPCDAASPLDANGETE